MNGKKVKFRRPEGDVLYLSGIVLLSALGVLFVYSASSYNALVQFGDSTYFFTKQLVGFLLGLVLMAVTATVDYRKWQKFGLWAWIVSLVLLALVFIPGVGKSNYGATRWIGIGGVTVQPSELAKYGLILFISSYYAKDPSRMRTLKGILPVLGAGLAVCVLIMLEPNMSVTMCVGTLLLGMIFLSGTSLKVLALLSVPVILAIPALIFAEPYRLLRLSAFLDPWATPKDEGYQLIQSLYALGNGGFFGVGLFNSRQKFRFLPFSESDFILSVIGEETGFLGVLLLFLLIGFLVFRGFCIASRTKEHYGYMLVLGITLVLAVQASLNALVVSGSIPPTGLPLPFISSGNTSLIVSMAGAGLVYNVSRHANEVKVHKIR